MTFLNSHLWGSSLGVDPINKVPLCCVLRVGSAFLYRIRPRGTPFFLFCPLPHAGTLVDFNFWRLMERFDAEHLRSSDWMLNNRATLSNQANHTNDLFTFYYKI